MKPHVTLLAVTMLTGSVFGVRSAAQTKPMNTITTAVPFLRIVPDARGGAMGDIGLATLPDANASFYNMGKVTFNGAGSGLSISYAPWLKALDRQNSYFLTLSGFHKLDDMQAITGGVRYLRQGEFTLTDELGTSTTTFSPTDLAIDAGYSRKLSTKTGFGLSLRYIHSKLAGNSGDFKAGNSVAADLGFYYAGKSGTGEGWTFGAALTNLGSKIGYSRNNSSKDYIPANLGLGTAYTKVFNGDNKFTLGLDVNKLLVPTPPEAGDAMAMERYRNKGVVGSWFSSLGDAPGGFSEEVKELQLGLGTEYTYNDQFSLRAGYFTENEAKGSRQYATVGAGLRYNVAGVNFSYLIPAGSNAASNPLKNTFRLSLVFDFDQAKSAK